MGLVRNRTTAGTGTTVEVGNGNASGDFEGVIADGHASRTLALTKVGSGTQILGGANTYTGATLVSVGTLVVNGSTAAASSVTVSSAAILGGSGIINGIVVVTGTLAPGDSPGILTVANNVTINTGGATAFELSGATVGTGYDRVTMTGGAFTGGNDIAVQAVPEPSTATAIVFGLGLTAAWRMVRRRKAGEATGRFYARHLFHGLPGFPWIPRRK